MIRRKTTDLLREVEKRPAQKPAAAAPAILDDAELQTKPNFDKILNNVGMSGKRFKVSMAPLIEKQDFSGDQNGVWLTTKQVCRLFDVTPMTLYHWTNKLGLPKTKLGGGKNPPVRFDEGMVLAWGRHVNRETVNADYLEWR
jgi:hypothetical protein